MELAPLAVFAFRRPDTFRSCIESLLSSPESSRTDLTVFVDGPRKNVEGESEAVGEVRKYAEGIKGFASVKLVFSEKNEGLAASVIRGVGSILEKSDRVIVVEDDLVLSPSFLGYMNTMLDAYADDKRIMQVSGFGPGLGMVVSGRDIYLNRRGESWSWAIWKDRWDSIDWEVRDYESLRRNPIEIMAFNDIGSDLFGMLKAYKEGRNNSWAIRLCYAAFKQKRYVVSPVKSLAVNDGFGPGATHSHGYNRYKVDFEAGLRTYAAVPDLEYDRALDKRANRYWNLWHRITGKIMGIIYGRR